MSKEVVRPLIKTSHVVAVKKLVNHPASADFDDSLGELLKRFIELQRGSNL